MPGNFMGIRMSHRQSLLAKTSSIVLIGLVAAASCSYAGSVRYGDGFNLEDKTAKAIAGYVLSLSPESAGYVVRTLNESDLLSEADRSYLVSSNAEKLEAKTAILLCEDSPYQRLSGSEKLEHILREDEGIGRDDYLTLLRDAARRFGSDVYDFLKEFVR